jgi:hypothetical protein
MSDIDPEALVNEANAVAHKKWNLVKEKHRGWDFNHAANGLYLTKRPGVDDPCVACTRIAAEVKAQTEDTFEWQRLTGKIARRNEWLIPAKACLTGAKEPSRS